MLFPFVVAIIRDEFLDEWVGIGIGLMLVTLGVGGGVGLVLVGVIVDHFDYTWIFWFVLVVIVFVAVATHCFVLIFFVWFLVWMDWVGAVGFAIGLMCFMFVVNEGSRWGWGSVFVVSMFVIGAVVLVVWGWFELVVREFFVDMRTMRTRPVWTTNVIAFLIGFGMFGAILLLLQLVQLLSAGGFGLGALVMQAGLFLLLSSVMILIAALFVGTLGCCFGMRVPFMFGIVVIGASLVMFGALHGDPWEIYVGSAVNGVGLGLFFVAMATLVVEVVLLHQIGVASGMNLFARMVGSALGA